MSKLMAGDLEDWLEKANGAQMGFGFGESAKKTPGGAKPPQGYSPIQGSKLGGFVKVEGNKRSYWYPDTGHSELPRHSGDEAAEQPAAKRIMGPAESSRFAADAADRKKEADAAHSKFHGTVAGSGAFDHAVHDDGKTVRTTTLERHPAAPKKSSRSFIKEHREASAVHGAKTREHLQSADQASIRNQKDLENAHREAARAHSYADDTHHNAMKLHEGGSQSASDASKRAAAATAEANGASEKARQAASAPANPREFYEKRRDAHRNQADKHLRALNAGGTQKQMDAHRKAWEAHRLAADDNDETATRHGVISSEHFKQQHEHSQKFTDAANEATAAAEAAGSPAEGHLREANRHLDRASFHRQQREAALHEALRLHRKNPDSPKAKKMRDSADQHERASKLHNDAAHMHLGANSDHHQYAPGAAIGDVKNNRKMEAAYIASHKANDHSVAADEASRQLEGKVKKSVHLVIGRDRLQKARERLVGGLGDGKPDSAFDRKRLARGVKEEREHTSDKREAKEIAKDHLTKDPGAYKKSKEDLKKNGCAAGSCGGKVEPKSGGTTMEKSGEGSRGGKVIGHTKSGKPIYDNAAHRSHLHFNASDHEDSAAAHRKEYQNAMSAGKTSIALKHRAAVSFHEREATMKKSVQIRNQVIHLGPDDVIVKSMESGDCQIGVEPRHYGGPSLHKGTVLEDDLAQPDQAGERERHVRQQLAQQIEKDSGRQRLAQNPDGGLDEWFRDAERSSLVNVPVNLIKSDCRPTVVVDDDDPYTRRLHSQHPQDGQSSINLAYHRR